MSLYRWKPPLRVASEKRLCKVLLLGFAETFLRGLLSSSSGQNFPDSTIQKSELFFLISPQLPRSVLRKQAALPLGDEDVGDVVRETLTGTTGMTWCLAHLITILIGVCRRGFYKW